MPGGSLSPNFHNRLETGPGGRTILKLDTTTLIAHSGGSSRRVLLAPAMTFAVLSSVAALALTVDSTAFGLQPPHSYALSASPPPAGRQEKADAEPLSSGAAFSALANTHLIRLGSNLKARAGGANLVEIYGDGPMSEISVAKDLLFSLSKNSGVQLTFEDKAPYTSEDKSRHMSVKQPLAYPTLQIVALTEKPVPSLTLRGGAKLRIGSNVGDGWIVNKITLRSVLFLKGLERHLVEF